MIVGILQADHVSPELLPVAGEYPDMIQALLRTADPSLRYRVYRAVDGELPASPAECHGYIVTGGKASAYAPDPWITGLLSFIRQCHRRRRKLIGVCLGHQAIALALGGSVEEAVQGWDVGVKSVNLETTLPWMVPARKRVSLQFTHKDEVVTLPPGAFRIGTNRHCPNNVFVIDDHVLAVQGHPEFNRAYARSLIALRRRRMGEARYLDAIRSLSRPTDESVMARWMVGFLRYEPQSRA